MGRFTLPLYGLRGGEGRKRRGERKGKKEERGGFYAFLARTRKLQTTNISDHANNRI